MIKLKHIVALFLASGIFAGLSYFLNNQDKAQLILEKIEETTGIQESKVAPTEKDTVNFAQRLQDEMKIISSSFSKRSKRTIWTLARGKTIVVYLLQAQKFIQAHGGTILSMEELSENPNAYQSAWVDVLTPQGDSLHLTLQVSENIFMKNASLMSVVFQTTSLTPEIIAKLNNLDYPFDMLIPPFGVDEKFYKSLDKIRNKEIVLWLAMESTKLNKVHNKLRPLRIHHTAEQIEETINKAKEVLPSAAGIATRYGEQAVKHKQLLQAILKPAEKNDMWFMDLSMEDRTVVPQTCKDFKLVCKIAFPYNPENSSIEDYIHQKLREAPKSGTSIMIIPLTEQNLSKIEDIAAKTAKQGTTLVDLSTLFNSK
ncbi:divergent polysaccharide deacetylase family protein [Fibrobacter sp. UBA4297]|uniref:divergent polysaccharide deacetylase family protein n=1 Tax=Fibrobacter sp. UBA4297 TaxID=1946536 RepID=UPI0025BFD902|nr:divergent polysaccharide deacetylase family protein [Fibrobacter sp. UBA4297]